MFAQQVGQRDAPSVGGFEGLFFIKVRWLRLAFVGGAPLTSTLGNMKERLIHPWVLAPACIAWTIISIYLCVSTGEWQWLSRSGAITILCGAALTVRRLLILGPDMFFEKSRIIDAGHFEPTEEELEEARQGRIDTWSLQIGSWLVIIGTFIAGYGDWLPRIFR